MIIPEICIKLNSKSQVGGREPCEVGAWIHFRPKPSVCANCIQKNNPSDVKND